MTLRIIDEVFSICKVTDYETIDLSSPYFFTASTDEEKSLVCPTRSVPANTVERNDGWRAFRIDGTLDFSLIGIIAKISKVLADGGVGIFAISTFNTDYILTKSESFDLAIHLLQSAGYSIDNNSYREEAIECVKDHVLPIHQQIYAKYDGDFDRIYSKGYNSRSYQGRVIEPGKVYGLSYLECSCPKVKSGLRSNPEQCECSRQSILYILSQLEPDSKFDVRIESTILRGSDRCSFIITRHKGNLFQSRSHLTEQSSGFSQQD